MTGPIHHAGSAQALVQLIRSVVAAPALTRGQTGVRDRVAPRKPGADARASASSRPELGALVASRARELDAHAPDFRHRLLRLVVEASLLHEFGSHLLNAPKFQSMIDQVLHELESAPQLQHELQAALQAVLAPPP